MTGTSVTRRGFWWWLSIVTILLGTIWIMIVANLLLTRGWQLYHVNRMEWWDRTEPFREGVEGLRYQSERHKWNVIRDVGRAAAGAFGGEETLERLYKK